MLSFPLPYIANTAGWMSAEIGRQPWVVYGLMRTKWATRNMSPPEMACLHCSDSWGCTPSSRLLFLVLVYKQIQKGPAPVAVGSS